MTLLTPADLTPFVADIDPAKAQAMIEDALAMATLSAPCLTSLDDLSDGQIAAFRALLRGAILRWNEAGTGAISQTSETGGPYTVSQTIDTKQQRKAMFWPSELVQLEKICNGTSVPSAFTVDTVPGWGQIHADVCSRAFGAAYCSCGADIAGFALYEA